MSEEIKEIEKWENLKLLLKLYGFQSKEEELKSLPRGQVVSLKKISRWTREVLVLSKIVKTEVNSRNTLKLVLFDNGVLGLIPHKLIGKSIELLTIPWASNPPPLWDKLSEGTYALLRKDYWDRWSLVATTDITKREDAQEFFDTYQRILEIQKEDFRELERVKNLSYDGHVRLEDLKRHLRKNEEELKKCYELERKEREKRREALKNIEIVEEKRAGERVVKITVRALDEHTYKIEVTNPQREISKVTFEDLVYRHRYFLQSYPLKEIKKNSLWLDFFERVEALLGETSSPILVQVDEKERVSLEIRKVRTRTTSYYLYYLNGVKISRETLPKTLHEYFIKGKELSLPKPKKGKRKSRKDLLTAKERELIENGISGKFFDLEGEIPINFGIEKEGSKWYLTVGEERIHIKGGLATIESIKNVIEGKANRYNARYSPEELYHRLSKIVDEETALEIITTAKEIGIMLRAITK